MGLEKTRMMPLPECQKCDNMFIRSDSTRIQQTDGQTDRIGKTVSHSTCIDAP